MSKTLGGILEIAAGTIIEAIPGVGQYLGPVLIQAGIATEVQVGLNALLGKTPKTTAPETAIRTERPPRRRKFGCQRRDPSFIL